MPLTNKGYHSQLNLIERERDRIVDPGQTTPLRIAVWNMSEEPWPILTDLGRHEGSVKLGILRLPQGQILAEQRSELPHTMFHNDEVEVRVKSSPVGFDGKRMPPGRYEVWIGLVQENTAWFYDKGDGVLTLIVNVEA